MPTFIVFPEANEGDLERYEGMLVAINAPLTVSQNYFEGRYGQVTLSAEGRLLKPTNLYPASSAGAIALANDNARRRIIMDDGSSLQNLNPIPYIGADNTLRAGDTVAGVTGVIDYGLVTSSANGASDYKIQPALSPVITRDNPRTAVPASVGGNVKVASFNVLNYFTTFTDGNSASGQTGQGCMLGGSSSAANCRGADNQAEFTRQRDKIISAIRAISADVVGLMEIQNNGNTALQNLVDGLNAAMGAGTYAAIALPPGGTGTDAIRVAMIYKPTKLTPVGTAVSDIDPIHNRPPLAQTFSAPNGEKFTVLVNHFKSKGSCPASATDPDADQGDGQGCWNALRVQQAQELLGFIGTRSASVGDNDVIVIGDLNAYGKEDPILTLSNGGLEDEIARYNNTDYSYVFDGESGYIDHALATASLAGQITGTGHWHINADEPSVIDYNTEFKQPVCPTCSPDLYTPSPYRASDHDPVLVGLNLVKQIGGSAGRDTLVGTDGDDIISGGVGADTLTGGAGRDQFVFDSVLDGVDTITDFQPGTDLIVLTRLLQTLGIASAAPLADGYVVCTASGSNGLISIDPDGNGPARSRALVLVKNANCGALAMPSNFAF
jgi:predicted extracellular nuclease